MVILETSIIETLNYFSGIIISVKTRSERQLLRLKQINIQLAAKIQHLEFSCSEKVRKHFWENAGRLQPPRLQHGASHCQAFARKLPLACSALPLGCLPSPFGVGRGNAPSQNYATRPSLSLLLSLGPHRTVAVSFSGLNPQEV